MSEPSDINQNIQDAKYVANSGDGNAVINVYNYPDYKNAESKLVDSDKAVTDDSLPCPYRGLFSFSPDDAEFFFGRNVFIEKLFAATFKSQQNI